MNHTQTWIRRALRGAAFAMLALLMGAGVARSTWGQEMCQIPGVSGTCGIAPFFGGEHAKDKEGYTCEKLRGAQYFYGQCVDGRLNGLVGLKQAADARWGRRASPTLVLLTNGVPQKVTVAYENWGIALSSIVDGRVESSFGCVSWSGGWDRRTSDSDCVMATQILGADIMQRSFAQQMLAGKVDLSKLSVAVNSAGFAPSIKDDPKTTGRGARGG